jgi:type II secretory ATPase GspE/PulE/Tfp pilus assembly ATPase PilB-like protein
VSTRTETDRIDFEPIDFNELSTETAVMTMVERAVERGASDLFLVANEYNCEFHIRRLGMMEKLVTTTRDSGRRMLNHVKVMAQVNFDEPRKPQEGRWILEKEDGEKIDLRVSTIPTLYGEDCCLRLLERKSRISKLGALGLLPSQQQELLAMLSSPGGLILVTGPTGSGKTTTLYACLDYLNNGKRKINTIEDPVEYALTGIRQSQVNSKLDVDFPELLRNVLRQAPDVVMIGEIRDPVTAKTAVRAANSGHLVLATLHAPVAAAAVQSMLALHVPPFFLANCLTGVLAQRLVRTLCPKCKQSIEVGEEAETFADVRKLLPPDRPPALHMATGCAQCNFTGVAGQTAVAELMKVTQRVRRVIATSGGTREIQEAAQEDGMLELRRSGLLKVAYGDTSAEEILRNVPAEYLGVDE